MSEIMALIAITACLWIPILMVGGYSMINYMRENDIKISTRWTKNALLNRRK